MYYKKFFVFFLLVTSCVPLLQAQLIPAENSAKDIDQSRIGSQYSIFPLAGYSSDFGFY